MPFLIKIHIFLNLCVVQVPRMEKGQRAPIELIEDTDDFHGFKDAQKLRLVDGECQRVV